jgi:hypothetical protein
VTFHSFSIQMQLSMKNILSFSMILFFGLLTLGFRLAQAESKADSLTGLVSSQGDLAAKNNDDLTYKQKARQRLYPGGRDEEPLRVQIQMSQPTRKMGPATEAPEPTSTSADD